MDMTGIAIAQNLLLALFFAAAGVLLLFGLNVLYTVVLFLRGLRPMRDDARRVWDAFQQDVTERDLPPITTQLPLFNERTVAERVIRAVAGMDYPADRHTIQVLDDSIDETRGIVDAVAAELRERGHRIEVVRRPGRDGFKAGALRHGLSRSRDEFFAIFDADFVPPRDFLKRTVAVLLARPEVGLAQARWGHLNAEQSFVTRAQGIGIDAHFAIEQPARAWNALFMNFNGTAGLWRRRAIEDAGGWECDTLTEDMDISYRAQLAGWKPYFLFDLVVPAELPGDVNAFKLQQFRWAKGSVQTGIKLLPRVFRAAVPLRAKLQAAFHMLHYAVYPLMVAVAFLSLPVLLFTAASRSTAVFAGVFTALLLSTGATVCLYAVSQILLYPRGWRRLRHLPALSLLGIGVALSNSRAVMEALFGIRTAFIRTPKKGGGRGSAYPTQLSEEVVYEFLLGLYCFATCLLLIHARRYLVAPFLLLYAWGFTVIALLSVRHFTQAGRAVRDDP
jgi:cellulose synthase/poly-beta-1,6-N-acetylglucosamine synthase-like glycosyltransferase